MSITLSKEQVSAIQNAGLGVDKKTVEKLLANVSPSEIEPLWAFSLEDLTLLLEIANATYRAGVPVISDSKYDSIYIHELQSRDPDNEYLKIVEPEPVPESKTVALPVKMLSTDKAYSFQEIKKWIERLVKAAKEINVDLSQVELKVSPKLDGYAAYDDGEKLYTRGDGVRGQDITRAFTRGLKVAGGGIRGQGAGEIVIDKNYFEANLSGYYENTRNIQASIIAEKKIDKKIQEAIDEGACVFCPFTSLNSWEGHYTDLVENFDDIVEKVWTSVNYDVDGVILETTNITLKEFMGSTRRYHKWQIAFKVNEEVANVKVLDVIPQTSRAGKLTPVAILEPTKLSGATISRATVHHYGMVKSKGIGKGAVVELVRSGLVIPKIERVIERVEPQMPELCPSCDARVVWDGDNLYCPNTTECPAQAENTLIHFFKTLGNVDGFGLKVISKIYGAGVRTLHEIYSLDEKGFVDIGFGDKTSENLVSELRASKSIEIEDWRFLAAFGVPRLGEGNSERLLGHHGITEIFSLSVEDLMAMDGFAEISAKTIFEGLQNIKNEFHKIYDFGFRLKATEVDSGQDAPLRGEVVVFTGSMEHGRRSDMEAEAKSLGAKVSKAVSGNTTYLVTGRDVGETKIVAARAKGVTVITEAEYLEMLDLKRK
jgi:DNA ligase (NAD+)